MRNNFFSKKENRNEVWRIMEEKDIARFPRPVYGRIPNFVGSEIASEKLEKLKIFKRAVIIKVNPDSPQKHIRESALNSKKILLMPSPRLKKGFILLDPQFIPKNSIKYASTIRGAFKFGRLIKLEEIPNPDLIIVGSVAASKKGNRLGKGEGYSDLECAVLRELGIIKDSIQVVTTIHEIQIIENMPFEEHDLTIDLIITPKRVIKVENRRPKPNGIIWSKIDSRKEDSIPILNELRKRIK